MRHERTKICVAADMYSLPEAVSRYIVSNKTFHRAAAEHIQTCVLPRFDHFAHRCQQHIDTLNFDVTTDEQEVEAPFTIRRRLGQCRVKLTAARQK